MFYMIYHYDYKLYPYKHYESVFTRFYQGYILPEKFNVDKRKLHYSALIMSGQLERADALEKCKGISYPSTEALQEDLQYFLKKMSWSPEDLKTYIARPEIPHSFYPTEEPIWYSFIKLGKVVKKYIKLGVLWVE